VPAWALVPVALAPVALAAAGLATRSLSSRQPAESGRPTVDDAAQPVEPVQAVQVRVEPTPDPLVTDPGTGDPEREAGGTSGTPDSGGA
jgi:hypothetical protein